MPQFAQVALSLPLRTLFLYRIKPEQQIAVGVRVRVPFRAAKRIGVVIGFAEAAPPAITVRDIITVIDTQPVYSAELLRLGHWMADYYCCAVGEALLPMTPNAPPHFSTGNENDPVAATVAGGAATSAGKRHDVVVNGGDGREEAYEQEMSEAFVVASGNTSGNSSQKWSLNAHQQRALAAIHQSSDRFLYLHGITGSGKSELLLQIAADYVRRGRTVLLLVPEISLALQMADSVAVRYPMDYAILHSRLSNAERMREWVRIIDGAVRLVIGVRSAVFAPLPHIDLIIIDEEQDGAYQSSFTPRYHARHIAMYRAAHHNATVLFSSATPSLEAWHHIKRGHIKRIDLPNRIAGASRPQIEIVNMQKQSRIISTVLEKAIVDTIGAGKQVILLHNRRGYGRTLMCTNCGYIQECPRCTVAMIYYQSADRMVCHYCAASEPKQSACPVCQSLAIGFSGFGTERVEQELAHMFPRFRTARIDTDSVRKRGALDALLTAFRNREIDILIGTQIVAKGLNFADVELVGIVLADAALTLPDFRAEEHAFMLLTQVAGRAGRFSEQGRVIIQTYRTDNRAIQSVRDYDLAGYYQYELAQRQELQFPPYSRLIRVVTRSKNEESAQLSARNIYSLLSSQRPVPASIYGPIPCAIAKIANQYRYQIMVSDPSFATAHQAIKATIAATEPLPATYVEIDIDPIRVL